MWTWALGTGPSSSRGVTRCHGWRRRGRSGLGRPLPVESRSVMDGVDAGARAWAILFPRSRAVSWTAWTRALGTGPSSSHRGVRCHGRCGRGRLGLDRPLPTASHGVIDGMDVGTRSGLGRPLPTESHSVIDSVDVGTWDWVVLITLCYRQHGCGHLGLGCPLPTESHGVVDGVVLGSRSGGCVEAVSLPIPCQCGLWSL